MSTIKNMFCLNLIIVVVLILNSCTLDNGKTAAQTQEYGTTILSEIDLGRINQSLYLAGEWMLNNQNNDGSLNYLYFPSAKRFSAENNELRQFMSTVALAEMHKYSNDIRYKEAFDKNLKYNMDTYYSEKNEIGFILFSNQSKLGAAAFALISVLESDEYNSQKSGLTNLILLLHNQTDGSFRTFYMGERNDNQNFYPGEAMLALMLLHEKTNNGEYIDAVKKSFNFYSDWHRKNRNPAFVPWHTMALYRLHQTDPKKDYADFIFEMNDFLVGIQDKDCSKPQNLGVFFDPKHEEYGPPHASSTAVYVEGLAYAYRLANELNDKGRAERYRQAIILGARSLIELQFKDDPPNRNDFGTVLGGIRTSAERDEIRIDNNQHTIMAFVQLLKIFTEEDIRQFISKNPQFICLDQ